MLKIFKILTVFLLFVNFSFVFAEKPVEMPLVSNEQYGLSPNEQRNSEFIKYLSVSLKISVSNSSGSGTIVFYDEQKNLAYVASCGHLWSGNMSEEEGRTKNVKCKVITWYHNEVKLNQPKTYEANVIFYCNNSGYDSSLIIFNPDWKPNYFSIAPLEYPIIVGEKLNSCGCDGGREVARYDVEVETIGFQGKDLVTRYNSPRPGRSGGGLMSYDGHFVGICWGTSDRSGNSGQGYFTSLQSIHYIWKKNNYDFLLNIRRYAQELPIVDRNEKQGMYPKDYILIPKF